MIDRDRIEKELKKKWKKEQKKKKNNNNNNNITSCLKTS